MVNQYAKLLKMSAEMPWRKPVPSLNYLLTSETWRQDHNGYSHQGPGFINSPADQEGLDRPHLPAARRQLPALHPRPLPALDRTTSTWSSRQAAAAAVADDGRGDRAQCRVGASIWALGRHRRSATSPTSCSPAAGDMPTIEVMAAGQLLREELPGLARPRGQRRRPARPRTASPDHPHGLDDAELPAHLHARPTGDLQLPRLPVGDPAARLRARQARSGSTSTATSRRARRPPRSTCRSAT